MGIKHADAQSRCHSIDDTISALFDSVFDRSAFGNTGFSSNGSHFSSNRSKDNANRNGVTKVSINARFEPDQIDISQEARYTVEFTNAVPSAFQLPNINGLRKRSEQVYQSSSNVNSKLSQKISYIFSFTVEREGIIEIPEYEIVISGESYTIPSSKLTVSRNPNAQSHDQQSQNQVVQITADIASKKAYVGQVIPATI
jgi:hypothetical protein